MAEIETQIANARKAGHSDQEIFQAVLKSPRYGAGFQKARASGLSNDEIAKGLGLNASIKLTKTKSNFTPFDNTKEARNTRENEALKKQGKTSVMDSIKMGLTGGIGGGAAQAFYKASDMLDSGINKITGTNYLPTNRYEKFTEQRKDFADNHNKRREANNQGFDWTQLGTNTVTELPVAMLARGYQGAKILSSAGAKVAAQNAAVGAGLGGGALLKIQAID